MKIKIAHLLISVALGGIPAISCAQMVRFNAPFAPSDNYLNRTEQPYRQSICLNGLWRFAPCELPASFKEGVDPAPDLPPFAANDLDKTPIRIPSPWNANAFASQNGLGGDFRNFPSYPKSWEKIKMGWLYRKFNVPKNWNGKTIILHFDAVAGNAEVMVNGKSAGNHFDIFLPFDLDVTALVKYGQENELCVGVRKASLFDKKGKYGRRTYQGGSFWGQYIAGVWQDVTLIAKPEINISNVYINPELDSGILRAQVHIVNSSSAAKNITVGDKVFSWINKAGTDVLSAPLPEGELGKNAVLQSESKKITLAAGAATTITITQKITGQLKTWSPDAPNLYGMVVSLSNGQSTIDSKYVRFGWRQTQIVGKDFLLNGKPIILRGDSWHFMGIPQMTRRYAWAWFKALKDAHLNTVRLHAQPYPSFYLDVADEMGIMVLDESAMWASDGGPKFDDPAYWKDSERHMRDLVLRDRNHASVFGWSIANENLPIIRNVMHNPPGLLDILIDHYRIWADTCRKLDPSRPWISADGDDDGIGRLPTYIVHYGGNQAMDRGAKSTKPWGVGEAGNAYYGTPEQVAGANGNRAYSSFEGRMEGVAASSYQSLIAQRQRKATYRSVFNLVWYGLQPLPLGLKDTTRAPELKDGVYFNDFVEGVPGVQPERLGPYSSTLNPGYDPALPLYRTWPLFEAIKDASGDSLTASRWADIHPSPQKPGVPAEVKTFRLLYGSGSSLEADLKQFGVVTGAAVTTGGQLLIVDGIHPPDEDAKKEITNVLNKGGEVIIWGVDNEKLNRLNRLLPATLAVTDRKASSLIIRNDAPIVSGLGLSDLYFSEQSPAEIIQNGLSGKLVDGSQIILEDCNTDWLRWNKQPEFSKTISVLRSEREQKQAGTVLISKQIGKGELFVSALPPTSRLLKVQLALRKIFANLGVPLDADVNAGSALEGDKLVHALSSGIFETPTLEDGMKMLQFDVQKGAAIKNDVVLGDNKWHPVYQKDGLFMPAEKEKWNGKTEVAYLSFWISSPRSLEDLLLEPNLPTVFFDSSTNGGIQVWLNGEAVLQHTGDGKAAVYNTRSKPLKLKQGWNQVIIKLVRINDQWTFNGHLTSNQPEFLKLLASAIEKP